MEKGVILLFVLLSDINNKNDLFCNLKYFYNTNTFNILELHYI